MGSKEAKFLSMWLVHFLLFKNWTNHIESIVAFLQPHMLLESPCKASLILSPPRFHVSIIVRFADPSRGASSSTVRKTLVTLPLERWGSIDRWFVPFFAIHFTSTSTMFQRASWLFHVRKSQPCPSTPLCRFSIMMVSFRYCKSHRDSANCTCRSIIMSSTRFLLVRMSVALLVLTPWRSRPAEEFLYAH